MLEAFLNPIDKDKIFVLELSSYQLDDIEFSPDVSVVTNLFPEHMNYHNGSENYYKAKKNIINFQGRNDIFVYNPGDKKILAWAKDAKAKLVPFADEKFLTGIKIPLLGSHNKKNIRAAVAVAKEFGISDVLIKAAIEKFKPLPHRLEFVGEFNNIKFYDDAISTTPESTIEAIKSLKNIDTIFLGGEDRGYDFSQLEKTIKKYKINNAVIFPDSGNRIKLSGLKILKLTYKNTKPGSVCLLSCASPSYSLWKNFEEKGELFKKFVKDLSK